MFKVGCYYFVLQDAVLGVDKEGGRNGGQGPKKSYVPPHLRGKQGGGGGDGGDRPPPERNNERGGKNGLFSTSKLFCAFRGRLDFVKNPETLFFPLETRFSSIFRQFYAN